MLVLLASIMTLILHRAMCSRLEAAEGGASWCSHADSRPSIESRTRVDLTGRPDSSVGLIRSEDRIPLLAELPSQAFRLEMGVSL